MSRYVVDASVAVKWLLPEPHDKAALTLLDSSNELLAPELIIAEVGSALWKRVRRDEMDPPKAQAALRALQTSGLILRPMAPLIDAALELACGLPHNIYDCVYAVLAVDCDCRLVTADAAFHTLVRRGPLADHVVWVGSLPN